MQQVLFSANTFSDKRAKKVVFFTAASVGKWPVNEISINNNVSWPM